MTTIACDGKTVSVDSLALVNGMRVPFKQSKIQERGGYLFAHCGTTLMFEPMIRWYLDGADPAKYPLTHPEYHFAFIVFFPTHCDEFTDKLPYPDRCDYPCTFGSGDQLAMGAMLHGATPYEALCCATRADTRSGGTIVTKQIPRGGENVSRGTTARGVSTNTCDGRADGIIGGPADVSEHTAGSVG